MQTRVIPHTRAGAWPQPLTPSRFASRVRTDSPEGCDVALLGLADELGVRLNGGRPGASHGPEAVRAALARYGVADASGFEWPTVFDAGDIVPAPGDDAQALRATHERVSGAVRAILAHGMFPVGIGGGHDLTFPFVRGVIAHHAAHDRAVQAGVYFDAHLDVREAPGSGMPFRSLITECGVRSLHVHGLDLFANSREHVAWFGAHGGVVQGAGQGTGEALPPGPYFASIDLDVLDASHMPGVSAMNPAGWTVRELDAWAGRLGADPGCVCVDLMELSPGHDLSGRSARVAARLLLSFLRGFSARGGR